MGIAQEGERKRMRKIRGPRVAQLGSSAPPKEDSITQAIRLGEQKAIQQAAAENALLQKAERTAIADDRMVRLHEGVDTITVWHEAMFRDIAKGLVDVTKAEEGAHSKKRHMIPIFSRAESETEYFVGTDTVVRLDDGHSFPIQMQYHTIQGKNGTERVPDRFEQLFEGEDFDDIGSNRMSVTFKDGEIDTVNLHLHWDKVLNFGLTRYKLGTLVHAHQEDVRLLFSLLDRLPSNWQAKHSLNMTFSLPEALDISHVHSGMYVSGILVNFDSLDTSHYIFNPDSNLFEPTDGVGLNMQGYKGYNPKAYIDLLEEVLDFIPSSQ